MGTPKNNKTKSGRKGSKKSGKVPPAKKIRKPAVTKKSKLPRFVKGPDFSKMPKAKLPAFGGMLDRLKKSPFGKPRSFKAEMKQAHLSYENNIKAAAKHIEEAGLNLHKAIESSSDVKPTPKEKVVYIKPVKKTEKEPTVKQADPLPSITPQPSNIDIIESDPDLPSAPSIETARQEVRQNQDEIKQANKLIKANEKARVEDMTGLRKKINRQTATMVAGIILIIILLPWDNIFLTQTAETGFEEALTPLQQMLDELELNNFYNYTYTNFYTTNITYLNESYAYYTQYYYNNSYYNNTYLNYSYFNSYYNYTYFDYITNVTEFITNNNITNVYNNYTTYNVTNVINNITNFTNYYITTNNITNVTNLYENISNFYTTINNITNLNNIINNYTYNYNNYTYNNFTTVYQSNTTNASAVSLFGSYPSSSSGGGTELVKANGAFLQFYYFVNRNATLNITAYYHNPSNLANPYNLNINFYQAKPGEQIFSADLSVTKQFSAGNAGILLNTNLAVFNVTQASVFVIEFVRPAAHSQSTMFDFLLFQEL